MNQKDVLMKSSRRMLFGIAVAGSLGLSQAFAEPGAQPAPIPAHGSNPAPASAPAPALMEGTVVTSVDATSYTYVQITKDGKSAWIVGPQVAVKAGSLVRFPEGVIMTDFYSNQLKRTFPSVMFVDSITVIPAGN